jgi:hypothetical protein
MLLVELTDDAATSIARWDVIAVAVGTEEEVPQHCRSGEGHPAFGRHWCIDKRFGLGERDGFRWGRTDRVTDVSLAAAPAGGALSRELLASVIGQRAFNGLALHAITLGLVDPLRGRWLEAQEPGSPRVLVVWSGEQPVAEVVDIDRDQRADVLVVALRHW